MDGASTLGSDGGILAHQARLSRCPKLRVTTPFARQTAQKAVGGRAPTEYLRRCLDNIGHYVTVITWREGELFV